MRFRVDRALFVAACLSLLTGCESLTKTAEFLKFSPAPETTGSVSTGHVSTGNVTEPALEGVAAATEDPNDDVAVGKRHFRESNYGLAEQHFRRAAEKAPGPRERDAEAWLGLAASYDRLRRFDLADRAYKQAINLVGPTAEVLNNQGFSYMMRGDYRRARGKLLAAYEQDPNNPYIQNNLALLDKSARRIKKIR
jgi:Flp pilus assembly protein TadD